LSRLPRVRSHPARARPIGVFEKNQRKIVHWSIAFTIARRTVRPESDRAAQSTAHVVRLEPRADGVGERLVVRRMQMRPMGHAGCPLAVRSGGSAFSSLAAGCASSVEGIRQRGDFVVPFTTMSSPSIFLGDVVAFSTIRLMASGRPLRAPGPARPGDDGDDEQNAHQLAKALRRW